MSKPRWDDNAVIYPKRDKHGIIRDVMVTNALKGDHQEYETPTVSRKRRASKGWGRTHSTAHRGRQQDRKPTERIVINRVTGSRQSLRSWEF